MLFSQLSMPSLVIPREMKALTMLILWFHGMQQLRVFRNWGILVATIVEIGRQVTWVFALLLFFVAAFGHSFYILVGYLEGDAFQSSYVGNIVDPNTGDVTANITLASTLDDTNNHFRNPYYALRTTWFFLQGDWGYADAISDRTLEVMAGLFSFSTGIVFLNILIAFMTDVISETKKKGRTVWLQVLAEVIAEIEIYWYTRDMRRNQAFHPRYIYFEANTDVVKNWANRRSKNEDDE